VLVLQFHTNGGPIVFTGQTHRDLPAALEELSLDKDNKALVITGTGDSFMDQIDGPSLGEIFKPAVWEKTRSEGAKILERLLDVPWPVVGVANGPATVHSEYLLLSDVHIASERATYSDYPHPAFGITAGDGLHVVWEEVAGSARAKWLLWTGDTIDAHTALQWGVINEVVPHDQAGGAAWISLVAWPPSPRYTDRCRNRRSISTSGGVSPKTCPSVWHSRDSPAPT
jgi:enoyl-CoA hydratase/carnithine racemase